MAATRIDGTEKNGLILEQDSRFTVCFAWIASNPRVTYAKFSVREYASHPQTILSVIDDTGYLLVDNHPHHTDIIIDLPATMTETIQSNRKILYYELEIAEYGNINKKWLAAHGKLPWKPRG